MDEHAAPQPAQRRPPARAASPASTMASRLAAAGAQSNGASSVAREHVALVRPRAERRRRVPAVGDGGLEIEGISASACPARTTWRRRGRRRTRGRRTANLGGASATMRERLHYAFSARHPPRSPRGFLRAGPPRPGHRRRRFRRRSRSRSLVVRFVVFPQIESYRDTLASLLSRQLGQPVEIAVLSTGWDGWNPKLVVEGFRVARSRPRQPHAAPAPAEARDDRLVDVGAADGAAPEGAHHRRTAPCDQARSFGGAAHRRARVRSGAGGGRAADHRLDPAPARDRHPRRADRVGRRPAQRAAARARPRAVPAGEPLRAASLRIARHAARRARVAARPARRSRAGLDARLAERAGHACSCGSTTPTSRRGASGCRCRERSRPGPARCASGSSSPDRSCARSSPTSSSPTSRPRSRPSCRRSSSRIFRGASARANPGRQREVFTRALAFTTPGGDALDPRSSR